MTLCALGVAAAASAAPVVPSADPFYTYAGSQPLSSYAQGTVLGTRQIEVTLEDVPDAAKGTQVLYRTTNQLGQPVATVATVIDPTVSTGKVKLLSAQSAYDGLSDTCRPSYQLQGGTPTGSGSSTMLGDELGMVSDLAQGYTIVTADYEGPTDDYTAGREEGDETLDGVLAAEHVLNLSPSSTPVGLSGYSGGAIATMWAAERQPTYAPQLDLLGSAAGGIAVDFFHNIAYINGTSPWGAAIPALLLGLTRAYHVNPDTYLNAYGQQLVSEEADGCLGSVTAPKLTFQSILKPQYQDWQKVPELTRIFNDTIMGRESTPREPLLMGVGNADGTGDGVMVAQDVQELASEYCSRGANVQLRSYPGLDHDEAAVSFAAATIAFFNGLYAGQPATNGCSSITPGDSLAPFPVTTPPTALRPAVRITHAVIGDHGQHSAAFTWRRTGSTSANRAQCALAVVSHGSIGRYRWSRCGSSRTFRDLRAGRYEFLVRLGNKSGYGRPAERQFTIKARVKRTQPDRG